MKKTLSLMLCIILLAAMMIPAHAAGQEEVIYSEEIVLEDGTVMKDEIVVSHSRASGKTATRRKTFTRADVLIAEIAFQATFIYDGSTVYVSSKSVTQTSTYDGWNYKQTSFVSSGGTVTLTGKLTKLLVVNVPVSMSLTCDKNGNLSI